MKLAELHEKKNAVSVRWNLFDVTSNNLYKHQIKCTAMHNRDSTPLPLLSTNDLRVMVRIKISCFHFFLVILRFLHVSGKPQTINWGICGREVSTTAFRNDPAALTNRCEFKPSFLYGRTCEGPPAVCGWLWAFAGLFPVSRYL